MLHGGTLSYYDSQEDAWKGCKGSIKISVCEIQGRCAPLYSVHGLTRASILWVQYWQACSLACCCFFFFFFSSFLWLYTSWPDHTRRAVLLPQSHQCSRKAEMAGGAGNSQSLPYRQPNQERKRYLDTLQDTVASKNRLKAFRPGIVQTILTYKCCKAFARLLKLWSAVCVHNEYRASGEYRGAEN